MGPELVNHRFLHDLGITPRILVVDDAPGDAKLLNLVLGAECRVFVATRRNDALKLASRRMFDLILVDYELDQGNALDLLRDIRLDGLNRHTPALVVTGHVNADLESSCLNAGAADFISKPFSPQVLRARVKTQLLLRVRNDMLRELLSRDEDTGLYQGNYLHEQLRLAGELARRNNTALSVIACDLDDFTPCTEGVAPTKVARLLQKIAAVLEPSAHGHRNTLARQGADRFVWLLPDLGLEAALALAEHMRQRLNDVALICPARQQAITASFGVCSAKDNYPPVFDEMVACAERQLELARTQGHNAVSGGAWQALPTLAR